MIFEVSASTVAGVVGWKESVATVTAPPSTVVSRPPLDVACVAQPEPRATTIRAAERRSLDFMGQGGGRWGKEDGFARSQVIAWRSRPVGELTSQRLQRR